MRYRFVIIYEKVRSNGAILVVCQMPDIFYKTIVIITMGIDKPIFRDMLIHFRLVELLLLVTVFSFFFRKSLFDMGFSAR